MSDQTPNWDLPFAELGDTANIENVAKPLAQRLETIFDAVFNSSGTLSPVAPLSSPTFTGTVTLNSALAITPGGLQAADLTLTTGNKPDRPVDTTAGAVTITLPSSPIDGQRFHIFDAKGAAATNNITIARNGKTINGAAANLVIATAYGGYQLIYSSSLGGWLAALSGVTHPPGYEFGRDVISSPAYVTTDSSAPSTVIACSAHTFDGSAVNVTFYTPLLTTSGPANTLLTFAVFEGTTLIERLGTFLIDISTPLRYPQAMLARITPSAGSHTYTVKAWVDDTTVSAVVDAGPGGASSQAPTRIRFNKA